MPMITIIRSFLPHRRAQVSAQRAFEALLAEPEDLALEPKEPSPPLQTNTYSRRRLASVGMMYGRAEPTRDRPRNTRGRQDNDNPAV